MSGNVETVPSRRGLLLGLGAALVGLSAPAIIRTPGLLMPVKAILPPVTPLHWTSPIWTAAKRYTFVVRWDERGGDEAVSISTELVEAA